jgi:hypothetical protein
MNNKIEALNINGNIYFNNYCVIKEKENFYGVYLRFDKYDYSYDKTELITSGKTLDNACKKAQLLQTGFNTSMNYFSRV